MDFALLLVILGGFLEPVWVIGLQKWNETRSIPWGIVAVVFMILSPAVLAFSMQSMNVGVAYSIWTGIGAVTTVISSVIIYEEKLDRMKVLFIFMIIAGVVGLELSSEVAL